MNKPQNVEDVVIIGGGPAGLTAASYFGRFRRPAFLIDGGSSRARWIPESHNIPGFPGGVGGEELLSRLRAQAIEYGAMIIPAQVLSSERSDSGFAVQLQTETVLARFVLLATGVADHLPPLAGATEALLRSVLRVCPI